MSIITAMAFYIIKNHLKRTVSFEKVNITVQQRMIPRLIADELLWLEKNQGRSPPWATIFAQL
jgi:hypothetical protein